MQGASQFIPFVAVHVFLPVKMLLQLQHLYMLQFWVFYSSRYACSWVKSTLGFRLWCWVRRRIGGDWLPGCASFCAQPFGRWLELFEQEFSKLPIPQWAPLPSIRGKWEGGIGRKLQTENFGAIKKFGFIDEGKGVALQKWKKWNARAKEGALPKNSARHIIIVCASLQSCLSYSANPEGKSAPPAGEFFFHQQLSSIHPPKMPFIWVAH